MAYQQQQNQQQHVQTQLFNSPFGDTTLTKVFVGGLAWETQSETLRRHFEQYGDILEAVVITDKNTARSKGYGFVSTPILIFFFFLFKEVFFFLLGLINELALFVLEV